MTERSSYRVLLGEPVTRWQLVAGSLAQMTQGAATVGIILVVRQQIGSLALAGAIVGVLNVAAGIARPVQGRLIDRRGSRAVLAACGVIHGAALAAVVWLAHIHAPGGLLVVLGGVAGAALPPVSTTMRIEWGRLSADGDRTSAYSLVYLTQELAILGGPLILAAIVAAGSASAALVTVALIATAGSVGFSVTVRTPPVPPRRAARQRAGRVLRNRAIQLVLATMACTGGAIGALEVAAPTLATAHHEPAAAGLLLASLSIGGVLGATIYGARRWQAAPARRLTGFLAMLTAVLAGLVAVHGLLLAGALLFLAGIPLNPALTTFSLIVDAHVDDEAAGEAFGWLSTAVAGGTGAASAIAAAAAQHQHDPRAAFAIAAIAGALALVVALTARRTLAH